MTSSLIISSIVMFFCLSSSLFSPASPTVAATSINPSLGGGGGDGLLQIACKVDAVTKPKAWDYDFCIKVLKSNPKVASSRDLPTLAVNLINTGIFNTTKTENYIQNTLKRQVTGSPLMKALKACDESYGLVLNGFQSALEEVGRDMYYDAAYDLNLSRTNALNGCEQALASYQVRDRFVLSGNTFVILFSATAGAVCTRLDNV